MSIVVTGLKISLTQLAKTLATEAPGTSFIALNGAVVAGEIAATEAVGQQSEIYIPVYGPAGIDAGVVSYTAVTLGYLAGLGIIVAAAAGLPVAAGVVPLATGAGLVVASRTIA